LAALFIFMTDNTSDSQYVGRFAPSPSGPLHMGSLVAAVASYLDARSHKGQWLMRMEDLDPPRETQEAADQILFALDACHLHWDGKVLYQSQRYPAYQEAITDLQQQSLVFACDCSRQQIQEAGGVYPGTCRERKFQESETALRCKVPDEIIRFEDRIQGIQSQNLAMEVGDFVIRRKDGLYAYQLAVVVDDAFQQVTHIVRGIDLLDSTTRQIYLQRMLKLNEPAYAHIPVIVNNQGQKLSKQHMAIPIETEHPDHISALLVASLEYLGMSPDSELSMESPQQILAWGVEHWNPANLQNQTELSEKELPV